MRPKAPHSNYLQPSAYSRRSTSYVDRDFQLKYTKYILTVAIVSAAAFLLPSFLLANQNYDIFLDLADLLNPDLAHYIAKERWTLNLVFAATFVANIVFWFVFSKKMTAKIAGPAKILRNHIRLFSRGDFTLPPVRLRDDDEFKELISAYNYLFTLLQVQNQRELEELKKIQAAISNPLALDLITQMIDDRDQRLQPAANDSSPSNLGTILNNASASTDEGPAATRGSRHAS